MRIAVISTEPVMGRAIKKSDGSHSDRIICSGSQQAGGLCLWAYIKLSENSFITVIHQPSHFLSSIHSHWTTSLSLTSYFLVFFKVKKV